MRTARHSCALQHARDVAVDGSNAILVADLHNNRVRKTSARAGW